MKFLVTPVLCCLLTVFRTGAAVGEADVVFRNAAVYTMDTARSWAEAVAIQGERIVYVGTDSGITNWMGPKTKVINLDRRLLLPGFHDSHVHPVIGGIGLQQCQLHGLTNQTQILKAIEEFAQTHPKASWIRGGGWALPVFPGANPRKEWLDGIVSDRPVLLYAQDGHSAWVNSRALAIAGITGATSDPLPGRIERDEATGEPSGTLREDAMNLLDRFLPPYTADEYLQGLQLGMEHANRFGITSVVEADASEDLLRAYAQAEQLGRLNLKVVAALHVHPLEGPAQVARLKQWREKYQGRRLRPISAKVYADGVIEAGTAALLEPYLGKMDDRGKANIEPGDFNPLVAALDREGFQVHVHAIGDRAVRNALDAFEFAQKQNGRRDSRHQVAHIELWNPTDIPRLRELGVMANFQALWAYADPYITDLTLPVLGPERSRWLYPIRSIVQSGATLAGGSDWNVSSIDPVDAIQIALTRRGLEDGPGPAWIPEETVDLPTMLAVYTINGAYASFQERETGSLEVGKAADLIVMDRNLFTIPAATLHEAKVQLTLLDGKAVYWSSEFTGW